MNKSELLRALQVEIGRHDFSTFLTEEPSMADGGPGIVTAGCPACRKRINTMAQFIRHINEDVLPPLLDKLSKEMTASEKGLVIKSAPSHEQS
jgi:hypothetical protein